MIMEFKNQKDLFGNPACVVPYTEGIKYAGSKLKILPYIIQLVAALPEVKTILDGFSGTTRVSQAFAQLDYNVVSNDVSVWSEVFATCYLKAGKLDKFYQDILDYLNNLKGYDGWFSAHYGGSLNCIKKPFQLKNTRKLDAIRDEIEKLNLGFEDKSVILTSLIYALDEVDSTIGHYVSYLAKWSERSFKDLFLKLPHRFVVKGTNQVYRDDVFNTIKNDSFDLAYFDPPYGSNNDKMPPSRVRYNSYYHIWTSVILNDKPMVFGKANRRLDSRDTVSPSVFEDFHKDLDGKFKALKALNRLILDTKAHYILLSYSSGGRATKEELMEILQSNGKLLNMVEIDYRKNIMSQMCWTNEWVQDDNRHKEYLFLLEKV